MAMRMPPQAQNTPALPDVNRTSLVFFGGAALILLNFATVEGFSQIGALIFHKGAKASPTYAVKDVGLQVLGLAILSLMAEYGGDGAGTFALLFVAALWLLWLVAHFGDFTKPGPPPEPGPNPHEKPPIPPEPGPNPKE